MAFVGEKEVPVTELYRLRYTKVSIKTSSLRPRYAIAGVRGRFVSFGKLSPVIKERSWSNPYGYGTKPDSDVLFAVIFHICFSDEYS